MPPYLSPLHIVGSPTLPPTCQPANSFLTYVSAVLHTCIPTPLALLSSLLGTLSIVSWLFAQLPQIYKNHTLKSTSGLSVFFLTEWLLGDVANLLGCLFTRQATWQVVIAGYYVFVDCCLCAQWVWYEALRHGRPLRPIWGRWSGSGGSPGQERREGEGGMHQVWNSGEAGGTKDTQAAKSTSEHPDKKTSPERTAQEMPPRSSPMNAFRIPNFARSPSHTKDGWLTADGSGNTPPAGSSPNPNIRRVKMSSSPMPSPKTVLYISLLLAVLSRTTTATPTSSALLFSATTIEDRPTPTETAGTIFSWLSTVLYLLSRLPQLYKNFRRRSTAGLSPALFAAAFFGNLFYSSSLVANPCAWYDFAPATSGDDGSQGSAGRGWVGPEGSTRHDWVLRALPFFLGAAGVLVMDALVGLQFIYFGEPRGRPRGTSDDEVVLALGKDGTVRRRLAWRRVSGWMRGWAPAVSVAATPVGSRAGTPVGGGTPRALSPSSRSGEGSESGGGGGGGQSGSRSIPIQANALEEARALLGTGRGASPRSYGAVGSPR